MVSIVDGLNYDPQGNLWIAGGLSVPQYAKIRHQNPLGPMLPLTLQPSIAATGDLQWANHHCAVGDAFGSVIWQVNRDGTTFGSTTLSGAAEASAFFILGSKVVAIENYNTQVQVFDYPAGTLHSTIPPGTLIEPVGAVISQ